MVFYDYISDYNARGGSKGIPKKTKKINGISLVNLSVMMAKFVPSLDILV